MSVKKTMITEETQITVEIKNCVKCAVSIKTTVIKSTV